MFSCFFNKEHTPEMIIKLLIIALVAMASCAKADPSGCSSSFNTSMLDRRAQVFKNIIII